MNSPRHRILIAAAETTSSISISEMVVRGTGAEVTCAYRPEDVLDIDDVDTFQAAVVSGCIDEQSGLNVARRLLERRRRPVVLIAKNVTVGLAVDALRLGVADLYSPPIDVERFQESLLRSVHAESSNRKRSERLRQQRAVLRRLLRDRRNVNQRIDLVCRDVIGAYRRLFQRVLAMDSQAPQNLG